MRRLARILARCGALLALCVALLAATLRGVALSRGIHVTNSSSSTVTKLVIYVESDRGLWREQLGAIEPGGTATLPGPPLEPLFAHGVAYVHSGRTWSYSGSPLWIGPGTWEIGADGGITTDFEAWRGW